MELDLADTLWLSAGVAELDDYVVQTKTEFESCAEDDPRRTQVALMLSRALFLRNEGSDADEAVEIARIVDTGKLDFRNPMYLAIQANLCRALTVRFERWRDKRDLHEAMAIAETLEFSSPQTLDGVLAFLHTLRLFYLHENKDTYVLQNILTTSSRVLSGGLTEVVPRAELTLLKAWAALNLSSHRTPMASQIATGTLGELASAEWAPPGFRLLAAWYWARTAVYASLPKALERYQLAMYYSDQSCGDLVKLVPDGEVSALVVPLGFGLVGASPC